MRALLVLFGVVSTSLCAQENGAARYAALRAGIKSWETAPLSGSSVSNLTLRRDVGSFTFRSGRVVLLPAIGGRIVGLWFEGEGGFSMTPPTRVEREQLERFTGKTSLDEPFTGALLFFTDSTADEIGKAVKGGATAPMPEAGRRIARALPYIMNDDAQAIHPPFVESYLNSFAEPTFDATMMKGDEGAMFFTIDPFSPEEVSYFDRDPGTITSRERRLINQFHWGVDYTGGGGGAHEQKERVRITDYRIDCSFQNDLSMTVRAEAHLSNTRRGEWWTPVDLDVALRVDSIARDNGERVEFVQKGSSIVWVRAVDGRMRFHYRGRVVARSDDWTLLTSSIGWYPQHGFRTRGTFDLTFHTSTGLEFASIGRCVSVSEADGRRTTRWVLEEPGTNASFHIGVYSVSRYDRDSLPRVVVMRGPGSTSGIAEQIGSDVYLSMSFFTYLYGPLPIDTFYAVEIPAGHGEAFPGLIHLSSSTFERNEGSGFHELFRAHEVAHQWWGIALGIQSYRDYWLGEAFAEYSGLMYMQGVLKNNDVFFKRLREYRERILSIRKTLFGSSRPPGPISLGWRNSTGVGNFDHRIIIYEKGAWVVHMLRNLLLDLNTMKEDRFRNMMRDFFQTFQGRDARTEDFRRVAEKHAGVSLGWFFGQWVDGTGVPTYRWAWKGEEGEGGKYRIRLRVEQRNVPDDFQMFVPIRVDFGDGKMARFRVQVKGARCEPVVPLLPLRPRSVTFNDLESVLCETEEVEYDE